VTWALRRVRLTWAAWAHELKARRCRCGPERRMAAALLDSGAGLGRP
jgi:hypothetical protein